MFSKSSPLSSGQHDGPIVFDENGKTGSREMTALAVKKESSICFEDYAQISF